MTLGMKLALLRKIRIDKGLIGWSAIRDTRFIGHLLYILCFISLFYWRVS